MLKSIRGDGNDYYELPLRGYIRSLMEQLPIESFLAQGDVPILDVRSPSEFAFGHIPGAISFPLFDDSERERIGTIYKQKGREEAIELGLKLVGPRLHEMVQTARSIGDRFRIHCWRGGMRSSSVAWLLRTAGMPCSTLEGGYKAYRKSIGGLFSKGFQLIVLTGPTGSRKTDILHALRLKGEQILDLEGLANHQGSSFGYVRSTSQPTTEQFQNELYHEARAIDPSRRTWIEDESFMIGRVGCIPELYESMQKAPHVLIKPSDSERLSYLVATYGRLDTEGLKVAVDGIRKRLGDERSRSAKEAIDHGDMESAARIILPYYDKRYARSLQVKKDCIRWELDYEGLSPDDVAERLMETCEL